MSNEGIETLLALYRHRYLEKARQMSEEEIEKLLAFFCGKENKGEEDALAERQKTSNKGTTE